MADNVSLPGTGSTIATDEVTDSVLGTVQVQLVKLMDGRDNGTNRAAVDTNGNLLSAIQALVDDSPSSYNAGAYQPLSLTAEGRLRVSSVQSDLNQIWNTTLDNPWDVDNAFEMENQFV